MLSLLDGITRNPQMVPIVNPGEHSEVTMQNEVIIDHIGPDGEVKDHRHLKGNLMTTWGLNELVEMIAVGTGAASNWIHMAAIGTDNTAPSGNHVGLQGSITDTSFVSLSEASMVRSDGGNRTLQYDMTFDEADVADTISEIGLFCSNSQSASMAGRRTFADINKQSDDVINATYKVIFNSSAT